MEDIEIITEDTKITAQNLLSIGYEPFRQDGKICYKKDKSVYWFENGVIMGKGMTDYVTDILKRRIKEAH